MFLTKAKLVRRLRTLCTGASNDRIANVMFVLCVVRRGVTVGLNVIGPIRVHASGSEYRVSNVNVLVPCKFPGAIL